MEQREYEISFTREVATYNISESDPQQAIDKATRKFSNEYGRIYSEGYWQMTIRRK